MVIIIFFYFNDNNISNNNRTRVLYEVGAPHNRHLRRSSVNSAPFSMCIYNKLCLQMLSSISFSGTLAQSTRLRGPLTPVWWNGPVQFLRAWGITNTSSDKNNNKWSQLAREKSRWKSTGWNLHIFGNATSSRSQIADVSCQHCIVLDLDKVAWVQQRCTIYLIHSFMTVCHRLTTFKTVKMTLSFSWN